MAILVDYNFRVGGLCTPLPMDKRRDLRVHSWGIGLGEGRTADPSAALPMNKMAGAGFASSLGGPWFGGKAHRRSLRFATPEFLSRLVALAKFMRSSLTKTAHVDLSDVAKQEFGYATVGMTNLFGGTGLRICLRDGRTAGPSTTLRSGRDDKFVWGDGLTDLVRFLVTPGGRLWSGCGDCLRRFRSGWPVGRPVAGAAPLPAWWPACLPFAGSQCSGWLAWPLPHRLL